MGYISIFLEKGSLNIFQKNWMVTKVLNEASTGFVENLRRLNKRRIILESHIPETYIWAAMAG